MPRTPNVAPALSRTRPARACTTAPTTAAVPTTTSEAVVAWCGLWPSRYTRAGTVRMDPPPPSAPRLAPISRPAATASRITGSHHPAGAAAGGHDGQPGARPGVHSPGQVDHLAALTGQHPGGQGGPVAGAAHGDHGALWWQILEPGGKVAERDVPGAGGVPGPPFGGLAHVQQDPALAHQLAGPLRLRLGPAREQVAGPAAHAALAAAVPVTRESPASAALVYSSSMATTACPAAWRRDAAMTARYPERQCTQISPPGTSPIRARRSCSGMCSAPSRRLPAHSSARRTSRTVTGRWWRTAARSAKLATGKDSSGWPPAHSCGVPSAAPARWSMPIRARSRWAAATCDPRTCPAANT